MWTSNWLALALVALALPAAAAGTVYRWVDGAGQVHYSDSPQTGAQAVHVHSGMGLEATAAEGTTTAAAVPTEGRTQLASDAAACEQKKKDLASYKSASKISQRDVFGNEKEFSGEERQKLLELTQKQVEQACAQ